MMFAPARISLLHRPALSIAILGAALCVAGCGRQVDRPHWPAFGGDADRGALTLSRSSCGSCHAIPGVALSNGLVGPPLTHFSRRTIIAGILPNTPTNLVKWIQYPQTVVPGNAMPNSGLSDAQARDVAAYLYTLR
jgi:cytochrome c